MTNLAEDMEEDRVHNAPRTRSYLPFFPKSRRLTTDRQDLLHRFTATEHACNLQLMRRTVRIETNNKAVVKLARDFFDTHQHGKVATPQFLWRIVCESDLLPRSGTLPLSAFSDFGLRYLNVDQRGFVAVDTASREAVAFLSDRFVESDARFRRRPPLDILFCMTAASLCLAALSGSCVSVNGRGILVFGPPNSGKTTAAYLAAKRGLEFHADQVVFLEMNRKLPRVWGDPFPAVFRPETLDFLPELRDASRHSSYTDLSFYYFDKKSMQSQLARSVTPRCSVFLERVTECETELRKISPEGVVSRLRNCMLFDEGPQFDEQVTNTLDALAKKPSYSLRYANDPKIAARVIGEMLR